MEIADLLGDIGQVFENMTVAEEELAKLFPSKDDEPAGVFMAACPREAIRGAPEHLYRAYVREQAERLRDGEPIDTATTAEVARFLSDLSLVRQLSRDEQAAYDETFRELFPAKAESIGIERADKYNAAVGISEARTILDKLNAE